MASPRPGAVTVLGHTAAGYAPIGAIFFSHGGVRLSAACQTRPDRDFAITGGCPLATTPDDLRRLPRKTHAGRPCVAADRDVRTLRTSLSSSHCVWPTVRAARTPTVVLQTTSDQTIPYQKRPRQSRARR